MHQSNSYRCSRARHVIGTITQFHSTIVMNYVAFYGLVCLYLMWTMKNAGLVVVREAEKKGCIQKYHARGYSMGYWVSAMPTFNEGHSCGNDITCPHFRRSLHDGLSLFVLFDNIPAHLQAAEATVVSWILPVPCSSVCYQHQIHTLILTKIIISYAGSKSLNKYLR